MKELIAACLGILCLGFVVGGGLAALFPPLRWAWALGIGAACGLGLLLATLWYVLTHWVHVQ